MNIRLLSITQIDSGTGAAGQIIIPFTWRRIDTSRFVDGVLLARLHATTTWPGSSTIIFEIAQDGYTDDDPALNWNLPTPGGFGTLVTFNNADSTSAPIVRVGGIIAALGVLPPLVMIRMKITLGAAASMKPTLSVDLNLKMSK